MAIYYKVLPKLTKPDLTGMLTLDLDTAAERVAVIDRRDFSVLAHRNIAASKVSGLVKIIVPIEYTTGNFLLINMLDDGTTYDLGGADKVQADVVDISTVIV